MKPPGDKPILRRPAGQSRRALDGQGPENRLDILDFSVYGNLIDGESDARLQAELAALGIRSQVCPVGRDLPPPRRLARWVWLRYDLRRPDDLRFIADLARRLGRDGRRVFPDANAIVQAEDKWETYQALQRADLPTVACWPAGVEPPGGVPLLLKPRVNWGGQGLRRLAGRAWEALEPGESPTDFICQPFIPHERTWTVAAAGGEAFAALEKRRSSQDFRTDGDFGLPPGQVPVSPGAGELACAALAAVGLVAGTVDLIEDGGRLAILEVNSAPCLVYESLPALNVAAPMVRSVLHRLEQTRENPAVRSL